MFILFIINNNAYAPFSSVPLSPFSFRMFVFFHDAVWVSVCAANRNVAKNRVKATARVCVLFRHTKHHDNCTPEFTLYLLGAHLVSAFLYSDIKNTISMSLYKKTCYFLERRRIFMTTEIHFRLNS